MKTTLELPDDLLIEAKSLAARRRTTLKALIENALRRELRPPADAENPDPERYEIGPLGFLVIKARPGDRPITPEQVRAIQDEMDAEDCRKALQPNAP